MTLYRILSTHWERTIDAINTDCTKQSHADYLAVIAAIQVAKFYAVQYHGH
jgi:hypothetical protein